MDEVIKSLIDKYGQSLTIKNYAESTVKDKARRLCLFFDWLEAEQGTAAPTSIDKITKEDIYRYQVYQYERINSRGKLSTVGEQNLALQAVKSFFSFLKEFDYLVADPARDIAYAKEPKRLPRGILTKPEARKVLHAPDLSCAVGYRDRTIMEVLYSSGIRKSEATNLRLQDVDYHDGFLRIDQGKGKKDRVVPMGKIACRYLENYIKSVRPEFIKDPYNDHLFLSLRGNKLSKNIIWEIVKKYGKKAKVKKTISPHTFRHTSATQMLRNRADIRSVQEFLGHSSLDSTQIYTRVSITDLKEVHSRCHPREKDRE